MKKSTLVALSVLLAHGSAPAAAEPPLRQPTEQWVVNFDDSRCIASRNYGTRERPVFLSLKAPPLGNVMQLSIVMPGGGGRFAEQFETQMAPDSGEPVQVSMLGFASGEPDQKIYRANLRPDQFDRIRNAASVRFFAEGELDEGFALSEIDPLMKVMEQCVADLRTVFNVAQADGARTRLAGVSSGSLQQLIRNDDYPLHAIEAGQEGSVRLAVLIDESGSVADCTVIETSEVAALDARACAIVRERARFQPIPGPDGRPAKAAYAERMTWSLGE